MISTRLMSEDRQMMMIHTFYSLSIVLTAYIFGTFPEKFYMAHVIKTVFYLITRYISFKQRKYHYYMIDYCYFVNIFSVYVSLFNANNLQLQKLIFVAANGPLALSVILFKNKIIYHSADQNTSVFIHVSSMLASYCYRWNTIHENEIGDESWVSFILLGIGFYMTWSIVYSIIMFMLLRKRIVEKGNMTMFDWAINNTNLTILKKKSSNEKVRQFMYTIVHATLSVIALSIAPVFWYYQKLHFAYITFIIVSAFWNGSSYYVRLEKIKKEQKEQSAKKN
jgi:hypothetical protein